MTKGKDDQKYIRLMDRYKIERVSDPGAAQIYLQAASKLRASGDVSDEATLAAAYL